MTLQGCMITWRMQLPYCSRLQRTDSSGTHLQRSQALQEPWQVVLGSRLVDHGEEYLVALGAAGHSGYDGLKLRILRGPVSQLVEDAAGHS